MVALPAAAQVGQLLWVGFEGTVAPDSILKSIRLGRVGGVVLFKANIETPRQTAELVGTMASAAPSDLPLLVAIDQEGGPVQRIRRTEWPPAEKLGGGTPEQTERVARAIGDEVAAIGCNVDFAPVLDVLTEPNNPALAGRCFGTDAESVTAHGLAYLRGLRSAGVIGCGKHFPGHGRTRVDSHLALPEVDASIEDLRGTDLYPFTQAISGGLDLIMTAHVRYSALDADLPATLSRQVVAQLLRTEIGYHGVVVTDDLQMKGVTELHDYEEVAALALSAGCDQLLYRSEEPALHVYEALSRRQQGDPSLGRRMAESASRVAQLKHKRLTGWRPPDPTRADEIVGSAAHRELARSI